MLRSEYTPNVLLAERADRLRARRSKAPRDRAIRHSHLYQSATLAHYAVALACLSLVTALI